jgi:hypothetical protein
MGNNIGGSFDKGNYKAWLEESVHGTIYLSLLLYVLLNTASMFVFGEIELSIFIYFLLFGSIFIWNKRYNG